MLANKAEHKIIPYQVQGLNLPTLIYEQERLLANLAESRFVF